LFCCFLQLPLGGNNKINRQAPRDSGKCSAKSSLRDYDYRKHSCFFGFSQERAAKVCNEASCLAEIGRKVNADYVAQARIGRFERELTIKMELYSSKSGVMVGSFTGSSKDIYGLLATIDEKAPILFGKLPNALEVDEKPPIRQAEKVPMQRTIA